MTFIVSSSQERQTYFTHGKVESSDEQDTSGLFEIDKTKTKLFFTPTNAISDTL